MNNVEIRLGDSRAVAAVKGRVMKIEEDNHNVAGIKMVQKIIKEADDEPINLHFERCSYLAKTLRGEDKRTANGLIRTDLLTAVQEHKGNVMIDGVSVEKKPTFYLGVIGINTFNSRDKFIHRMDALLSQVAKTHVICIITTNNNNRVSRMARGYAVSHGYNLELIDISWDNPAIGFQAGRNVVNCIIGKPNGGLLVVNYEYPKNGATVTDKYVSETVRYAHDNGVNCNKLLSIYDEDSIFRNGKHKDELHRK